ncbi:MAG TPA: sulfotransferase family 2 domain-containing protein [Phycisphaerales bacterium]|nr:sulfotransferase family 2 domain-containing protein [Phycisphaerales bacterium]
MDADPTIAPGGATVPPHAAPSQGGPLYFLHIPKTAGTSLAAWLESQFPADAVCPWRTLQQILAAPRDRLARYRLFAGHLGMYLPRLMSARVAIVTMLRDPLSRSVSHYRDIVARVLHPLHARVRAMSFEEFVHSTLGEAELLNLQCRYLALDDIEADYDAHHRSFASDPCALRAKYTDSALLSRAFANLKTFECVGVCERADEAAAAIARRFGWPAPGPLARLNGATSPFDARDLTPKAIQRVRDLTAMDRELYEAVAFAARVRPSGSLGRSAVPTHIPS